MSEREIIDFENMGHINAVTCLLELLDKLNIKSSYDVLEFCDDCVKELQCLYCYELKEDCCCDS